MTQHLTHSLDVPNYQIGWIYIGFNLYFMQSMCYTPTTKLGWSRSFDLTVAQLA